MKLSQKAQEALDKVVAKFQSGDLSPIREVARIQLADDAPAGKWSFSNKALAFCQTGSLDNRGYRQWQAAGRHVKKGETSGYILIPRLVRKDNGDGEEETKLVGFLAQAVFGYVQTEGEDVPEYTVKELPPLMDVAQALDIAVDHQPLLDALASCDSRGTKINLGTDDTAAFWHELGHAVDARLNGKLKGGQHEDQEVRAEFTACVLAEMYGFDHTGNAWRYISSYSKEPLQAVMKALSRVEEIVALIEEVQR